MARTYERQLYLDRIAVKGYLDSRLKDSKCQKMTPKNWEDFIRAKVTEKLDSREREPKTTTARKEHKDQYDAENDMQHYIEYCWKNFGREFYGRRLAEQEQDDPEPLPRIKQEQSCDDGTWESEESDTTTNDDENDESDKEEEGSDDEELDEHFKPKIVCRGFVIRGEGTQASGFRMGMNTKAKGKANLHSLQGKIASRGITKGQKWKQTKRSWKWVDGKMVVWPPYDAID